MERKKYKVNIVCDNCDYQSRLEQETGKTIDPLLKTHICLWCGCLGTARRNFKVPKPAKIDVK